MGHVPPVARALLVVDDGAAASADAARDLPELVVVVAATSLEIVRRLQNPSTVVVAVLVNAQLAHVNTGGVLALLLDEYPDIRRILMAETRTRECNQAVISGRAHAFVGKPWDRRTLLEALDDVVGDQ